jgi:hypothetical protein
MTTPFTNADTRERLNVANRREAVIADRDGGRRRLVVDTQIAAIGARLKNLVPRETCYVGAPTI